MKTSKIRANTEVEATSMTTQLPPRRRTDDEASEHFAEADDDFAIPLDDDLDPLDDLDLDDDDF